jgi:hypothetical protein
MRLLAACLAFVVVLLGAERWALAADGGAGGLQLLVSENSSSSNEAQEYFEIVNDGSAGVALASLHD